MFSASVWHDFEPFSQQQSSLFLEKMHKSRLELGINRVQVTQWHVKSMENGQLRRSIERWTSRTLTEGLNVVLQTHQTNCSVIKSGNIHTRELYHGNIRGTIRGTIREKGGTRRWNHTTEIRNMPAQGHVANLWGMVPPPAVEPYDPNWAPPLGPLPVPKNDVLPLARVF
jgi:hypothetical protein